MSMTDNTANVSLANQSLGMLGADSITVGSGTEQNHIYATTFFDDARDEILTAHRWNFAKKRRYAIQTTDPIFGYNNAFTKPTDCLKVLQIEQVADAKFEVEGNLIITDEGSAALTWVTATDYVADQMVTNNSITYICILAHTSGDTDDEPGVGATTATYWTSQGGDYSVLEIEYIFQETTLSNWPVYASQAFVINLARMLASPIKQNEEVSLNLQAMLYGSSKVVGYLDVARSHDAQEGGAITIRTQTWLNARR